MSLLWQAISALLCGELFLTFVLILSIWTPARCKKRIGFGWFSGFKGFWKTLFCAILLILIVPFVVSFQSMMSYSSDTCGKQVSGTMQDFHLKENEGLRNFCITGFSVLFMFVIYQLIVWLSDRASPKASGLEKILKDSAYTLGFYQAYREKNNITTLCLAYPCSVDAGINLEVYAKDVIDCGNKMELNQLCKLLKCPENAQNEVILKSAIAWNNDWGYASERDDTQMRIDLQTYFDFYDKDKKYNIFRGEVITEAGNECVGVIDEFLNCTNFDDDKILYLFGHGLDEKLAQTLKNNPADDTTMKSPKWRWKLNRCGDLGTPSDITKKVEKGDIVLFNCGFLSPDYVIQKLRVRDSKKKFNTIVIIIDSCYSGYWKDRMSELIKRNTLKYTRVILQTACGPNESSDGCYFTPLWCDLQLAKVEELDEVSKMEVVRGMQSPTFCDYKPPHFPESVDLVQPDNLPKSLKTIKLKGGSKFRFFDGPGFFYKYVHFRRQNSLTIARGIPNTLLEPFFESFLPNKGGNIHLLSFKLKHYGNVNGANPMYKNTPEAFFLVEWEHPEWVNDYLSIRVRFLCYHLHLHFRSFTDMTLSGISHVNVTGLSGSDYLYGEISDTKKYIRRNGECYWPEDNIIEKLVEECRNFVKAHGIIWDNEKSWEMKKTLPQYMIRSRSRTLAARNSQD